MSAPTKLHRINGYDALQAVMGAAGEVRGGQWDATPADMLAFLGHLAERGYHLGVPDHVGVEWMARALVAEAEVAINREALIACATIAGADVSGGPPTWPSVDVWAVEEVTQLRKDCDEG